MSLKNMKVNFKINLSINNVTVNLSSDPCCVDYALWFNKNEAEKYLVQLSKKDLLRLSKLLSEFTKLELL